MTFYVQGIIFKKCICTFFNFGLGIVFYCSLLFLFFNPVSVYVMVLFFVTGLRSYVPFYMSG
jgi:hypothetical protein